MINATVLSFLNFTEAMVQSLGLFASRYELAASSLPPCSGSSARPLISIEYLWRLRAASSGLEAWGIFATALPEPESVAAGAEMTVASDDREAVEDEAVGVADTAGGREVIADGDIAAVDVFAAPGWWLGSLGALEPGGGIVKSPEVIRRSETSAAEVLARAPFGSRLSELLCCIRTGVGVSLGVVIVSSSSSSGRLPSSDGETMLVSSSDSEGVLR